jgi:hypothetical protein
MTEKLKCRVADLINNLDPEILLNYNYKKL